MVLRYRPPACLPACCLPYPRFGQFDPSTPVRLAAFCLFSLVLIRVPVLTAQGTHFSVPCVSVLACQNLFSTTNHFMEPCTRATSSRGPCLVYIRGCWRVRRNVSVLVRPSQQALNTRKRWEIAIVYDALGNNTPRLDVYAVLAAPSQTIPTQDARNPGRGGGNAQEELVAF